MVRRHCQSLKGTWKFSFDSDKQYGFLLDPLEWATEIQVPFAPESKAGGIENRNFHSVCWYQRDFDIQAKGGNALLHFGAVDYFAGAGSTDIW